MIFYMTKIQLFKTIFKIPKMDCPSEERIIRMKLDDLDLIKHLDFNIPQRELTILHTGEASQVLNSLIPLNFGAQIVASGQTSGDGNLESLDSSLEEASLLKKLLAINGGMFVIELVAGIMAQSMGLIADSLDMLADGGVYGISLYAVGKSMALKKKSALTNGYFQFILGTGIIIETMRRFIFGSEPEPSYMIIVSLVALFTNIYCLALLSKYKEGEVHMQASYICSSTDVMANIGVLVAGLAVYFTQSPYPDLIIGVIITVIVLRGAMTILKLGK